MNEEIANVIIDRYLKIIDVTGEPNEKYKYDAIEHFQNNWNIQTVDFAQMFKSSFSKVSNLLYQNSWGFIYKCAENFPEDVREMFRVLYDENENLESRILYFQSESERLLPFLKEQLEKDNFNAQQDERTLSVYLGFRYPDKYCIYKNSYFKSFVNEFELKSSKHKDISFLALQDLLPIFRKVINERIDFTSKYEKLYPKPNWDDTNLMIQNLLFVTDRDDVKGIVNNKLNNFSTDNLVEYFRYLDFLIEDFSIKQNTQKCVFNVSQNQLNFTIGQKYIWCLHASQKIETFKIISEGEFGKKSEVFNSAINTHLNHIQDLDLLDQNRINIDSAIEKVYNKTVRSSYLKYNDKFIEKMAFDKDFRSSVLQVDRNLFEYEIIKYWIFQGNPKFYDVVGAIQSKDLHNWKVASHKKKIFKGDKVILWLTGENAGCYGLGITTTDVGKIKMSSEEANYYKTDYDENEDRIGLKILHDFTENPILWKNIKDNPIFENLNVGNQGTNFTATEEQYDEILRISQLNQNKMNHPLNQILFGCPGSGKTYSTKKLAVEIIENRIFGHSKEERDEILKLYDIYSENEQIRFTTFHQSLSYEDFIEGIKPRTVNSSVQYEIEDGIFTKISSTAQDNWLNSQSDIVNNLPFEKALISLQEEWEEDNEIKFPLKKVGSEFTIIAFYEKNLRFKKASGGTAHTLSFKTMKDMYYGRAKHSKGGLGIYYPSIIEKLKSYSSNEITSKSLENFVLIIDEINRGNTSSIFGELITLIEDDKRLGENEKIEVILPYSKEPFGVPPNLYLIGTMNTADRSVEALDTALRRRFSFIEMKSDPNIIGVANDNNGILSESPDINLIDLLTINNERIELLLDKDHQIGHSYFIGINTLDELKTTFKNKVIPLLEEYFYGDFGKIGLVLGDQFVETKSLQNNKNILSNFKGYEDVDFLTDKKIYTFKEIDSMVASDFVSIYKTIYTIGDEA